MSVFVWAYALESPQAGVQPYDDVVRVQQVGPNQIDVAIVVYILCEEGAVTWARRLELKDG